MLSDAVGGVPGVLVQRETRALRLMVSRYNLVGGGSRLPPSPTPSAECSLASASSIDTLVGLEFPEAGNTRPSADPVGPKHIVFNISGNSYRLVCAVFFAAKTLFVKFVGTHAQYDRIKVKEL